MCDITTCTGQVYINNNILGKERESEKKIDQCGKDF